MYQLMMVFLLLFSGTMSYAQIQTILTVGNIPITTYDVEEMRQFLEATSGGRKSTTAESLEALLYQSSLVVIGADNPAYNMSESEFRRTLSYITNSSSQEGADQRREIYEKFPEIFRLAIRSDKTKRALMYGEPRIREVINVPTSEKEKRDFYNKNKKDMKDSPFPKLNVLVFATEVTDRFSLSQLNELEEDMQKLAQDLNTSSDYNALRRKYNKIRFTRYSGETGLFTPDILVLQKGLPEEIIGVALQKTLNLGVTNIPIVKNRGIYIPIPIPLRTTKRSIYLTFKVLDVVEPKELSYDEAAPRIDEILRSQRGEEAVRKLVAQRVRDGQVTLTLAEPGSYKPVIDKFMAGGEASPSANARKK
ncbi:MAG: hypothetical protein ACRCY4_00415 [Brevinema sp.]